MFESLKRKGGLGGWSFGVGLMCKKTRNYDVVDYRLRYEVSLS